MKTEIFFDKDGWMNLTLFAETAKDAGGLVMLAMNAPKLTSDVINVRTDTEGVTAFITLKTMTSRSFENRSNLKNYIKTVK